MILTRPGERIGDGTIGARDVARQTPDSLAHVTQATTPEETCTYDAAHRLQSVTDSRGPTRLSYAYSPGGLRNSVTDSDGNQTSYLYDPVGRLIGIWAPTGNHDSRITATSARAESPITNGAR